MKKGESVCVCVCVREREREREREKRACVCTGGGVRTKEYHKKEALQIERSTLSCFHISCALVTQVVHSTIERVSHPTITLRKQMCTLKLVVVMSGGLDAFMHRCCITCQHQWCTSLMHRPGCLTIIIKWGFFGDFSWLLWQPPSSTVMILKDIGRSTLMSSLCSSSCFYWFLLSFSHVLPACF